MNCSINATSGSGYYKTAEKELIETYELSQQELDRIYKGKIIQKIRGELIRKHKKIKKYRESGAGRHLQYIDSKILEACMLKLVERDIPFMAIHDSLGVRKRDKKQVTEIMRLKYQDEMGREIGVG
ncbi:MAG: hypothetical protein ISR85_07025 [Kiritimatiellales bacterium]|nr:hypothetical protein [Kiritimatiellota bacterium]MBL7012658.1 hypothetical protein [Kiritimatiellales bacterium]